MKILENAIEENSFIQECRSTTFTVLFNDNDEHNDNRINFILGLIKYPEWSTDIDIFKYLSNEAITKLKDDKFTFFVFDASTEGFSPFHNTFFFDILYKNCKKYNVPNNKIIFVSSNLLDGENIKKYNKINKIVNSIHTFSFVSFRKMIKDLYHQSPEFQLGKKYYKLIRGRIKRQYQGKFILSLSRLNRSYRTIATCMLYHHPLGKYSKISHDRFNCEDHDNVAHLLTNNLPNFNVEQAKDWINKLPLVIDVDDFKTNHALFTNSHLHTDTLFQIVNETHVENWGGTSLFYSEKTFRSMINFHPFVIYGQQGCNKYLKKLGFKTYEDWIDYDFDDEPNPVKRYRKLLDSVAASLEKIKNMSRAEQIAWRFKNLDVLNHNFNLVLNKNYEHKKFKKFIRTIRNQCQ